MPEAIFKRDSLDARRTSQEAALHGQQPFLEYAVVQAYPQHGPFSFSQCAHGGAERSGQVDTIDSRR